VKLANLDGRATAVVAGAAVDIATSSSGRFGPDILSIYEDWDAFVDFAHTLDSTDSAPFDDVDLGPAVPLPHQVFAIGLNYRAHAEESGMAAPKIPATFTKFPASLTGPFDDVELAGDTVDWEVELVVVMGRRADRVAAADAWSHVAGLTVGQDLSERTVQFDAGGQFSLGKSYRGFGPMGPWVVSIDEIPHPDDLALGCSVNGETVQEARTSDLIFDVSTLIADLSAVVPLLPGDVIFTGTPGGVGFTRHPARFLQAGDVLESWIEGIGTIRNRMVPCGS
jgi:2-keto-4-pentenoate hydratase/2-oxohepta-3-ene-1,7-dioic acid hydratase in catechol pathway